LFLGVLLSLAVACTDQDDGGDEGAAGQLGQPCLGGTFCNDGLVCMAGVCTTDGNAGDGDGDPDTSGDGDGDPTTTGGDKTALYEGPCDKSSDCQEGMWCPDAGWTWCTMDCMEDPDCPPHPTASGIPTCRNFYEKGVIGGALKPGCVLQCEDASECPAGQQCFYSGLGSLNWCGV
jgi:hypothetical protein